MKTRLQIIKYINHVTKYFSDISPCTTQFKNATSIYYLFVIGSVYMQSYGTGIWHTYVKYVASVINTPFFNLSFLSIFGGCFNFAKYSMYVRYNFSDDFNRFLLRPVYFLFVMAFDLCYN